MRPTSSNLLPNEPPTTVETARKYANLDGSEGADLFLKVRKLVMAHDHVLQIHGFYVQDKDVRFDLVVGFEAEDRRALLEQVRQELMQALPEYNFQITLDADISD